MGAASELDASLQLREATDADLPVVAELQTDAFLDKVTRWCVSREQGIRDALRDMRTQPWAVPQIGLVYAKDSGKVIAACLLKFHGQKGMPSLPPCMRHVCAEREAYVEFICVADGHRGKGVGQALLRWADDTARQRGCDRISLDVAEDNPALRLYERHGYAATHKMGFAMRVVSWIMMGRRGFVLMVKPLS